MINLPIKKNGSTTLKEVAKIHPEILDEVDHMIAAAAVEERRMTKEEFKQEFGSDFVGRFIDPHYSVYEGISTPSNVTFDQRYVYGYKNKAVVTENLELKRTYESFSGNDATTYGTTQGGTVLKKRQSEGELRIIQLIVNSRWGTDPYCRNAIDNYTRYICGNGIRLMIQNLDVEDALEDFMRQTNISEMFNDFVRTTFKDGEGGIVVKSRIRRNWTDPLKSKVQFSLHKVFSEEIRGFEVHSEDPGKKYAYLRQVIIQDTSKFNIVDEWIADIEYFQQFNSRGNLIAFDGSKAASHSSLTEEKVICWFQHGDKRELRGRVPLEPALRDFRLYEDFKISRAVLNYERSKVLYIKHDRTAINRKTTSTDIKKSASPKGGVQLTLGPNEKYEMVTASLNAADADVDGLLFLYSMSAGLNIPIYILGMRADQQNYSAIKNTDSPFNQMILEYAAEYIAFLRKAWKFALSRYIQAGVLPEKVTIKKIAKEKEEKFYRSMQKVYRILQSKQVVTEAMLTQLGGEYEDALEEEEIPTIDIPIETIIADAVKPNPLENAKTAFIERKIGMVSSRTLAEKRGYIWAQELMRQLEEVSLGIWASAENKGQDGSSNASTGMDSAGDGLDSGKSVDDGSGTNNQD